MFNIGRQGEGIIPPPPPGFAALADDHPAARSALAPTGQLHDGDTFRLNDGRNARLYGVDAFELDQTGRNAAGDPVAIGQLARSALQPFAQPGGSLSFTGAQTYGRPVASLNNGGDAGRAILDQGYGLATPEYLRVDPSLLRNYMEAERLARLNRRGAHALTYQTPKSARLGNPDPWAKPEWSTAPGVGKEAVFFDDPTPPQGLRPEIDAELQRLWRDMRVTPEQLNAFAASKGFALDPQSIEKRQRDKKPGGATTYKREQPRLLTDQGDGRLGATARGIADPINFLDEMGAVVDVLGGTQGRENLWNSDRRFGDVWHNNLEQNRSVLANDEANHPWWRFGGQLAGGLAIPSASLEGVGLSAARNAMRAGAGRYVAEQAAKSAITRRLGTVGAIEGGLAGAGQGETWGERAVGTAIGIPAGAVLGIGTGKAAPYVADAFSKVGGLVSRPFRRPVGVEGEAALESAADGALDAGKAAAQNDALDLPDFPQVAPARVATTLAEARAHAVEFLGDPIRNEATGISATVSKASLGKMTSASATNKSVSAELHSRAVANADDLFRNAHLIERAADPRGEPTIEISRWGVNMATPDGLYPVKLTAKLTSHPDSPNPLYTVEVSEVGSNLLAPRRSGGIEPGPGLSRYSGQADPKDNVGAGRAAGNADMAARYDTPALYAPDSDVPAPPAGFTIIDDPRLTAPSADDVLPLPSNTVDGVEEAVGINAGRFETVRAPDERDVLGRHDLPSPRDATRTLPKVGPVDLVTWTRSMGGVRPEGGELAHYGLTNASRKGIDFAGGESRFGPLINRDGLSYDELGELAHEAGFFDERPTVAEFLDALSSTHTGRNRYFRPDDLAEVDAFEAARRERFAVESAAQEGAPLTIDRSEPADLADLDANAAPVRAYEECGENAPNFAGNIRLDKLDSPQSIKRALAVTSNAADGFDAARRGRITQAETLNLADDLGMTVDDLLRRRKGEAFNAEQALAARQLLARSGNELVNMARRMSRFDVPGEEMEAAFREAWLRHAAIQEQVAGMTAEAGRLLSQFRMVGNSRDARKWTALGDTLGGSGRLKEIADRIVDLENVGTTPAGINRFALRSLLPKYGDMGIELFINALLSGPQTHAVNILSNTLTSLAQLPEYAAGAAVGAVRRMLPGQADTDRILFSEMGSRAVGMVTGAREGMTLAARAFKTGDAVDAVTKIEAQQQRAIPGRLGEIIRIPTRALTAEDEFFKSVARRMELGGLAIRQARTEGLRGQEAKDRAAELMLNPPDDLLQKAIDFARYATFQTPLAPDSAAAGVSRFTQRHPLAKILLPFVRTPVNLLKFAVERSPAAPIMRSWRKEVAAGGVRRDVAIARALVGTGVMAAVYEMAAAGNITGGGPADEGAKRLMRADGWQPYSLKVGDTYYSYSRLDPFSTTIGTIADMVDYRSHMTDKQAEESFTLVLASILNNLSSKTWLSGLSSALEAVNDPDRYLDSFLARTAGSLTVPSIVAQVARTSDPVLREARTPMDRIKARIPGVSQSLPASRDVFGRRMLSEGGVGPDAITPIWTRTGRNDPVAGALLRSRVTIGRPQRKDMTGHQYEQFQEQAGAIAYPQLKSLVTGSGWRGLDADTKQDMVSKIVKDARKAAKAGIFGAPLKGDATPPPPGFSVVPAPPAGFVVQ